MNNETIKADLQIIAVIAVSISIAVWGYVGSAKVVQPTQAWEQSQNLKAEIVFMEKQ